MPRDRIVTLTDGSEIRHLLAVRPPAVLSCTFFLLSAMLVAALAWAAISTVDLLGRGNGSVRPAADPVRVQVGRGGEISHVLVREGDRVVAGDLLVRLDDELLRVEFDKNEWELAAAKALLQSLGEVRGKIESEVASESRSAAVKLEVAEAALEQALRHEKNRRNDAVARHELDQQSKEEATRKLERARDLYAGGLISRESFEAVEKIAAGAEIRHGVSQELAIEDDTQTWLARKRVQEAHQAVAVVANRGERRLREHDLNREREASRIGPLEKEVERLRHEIDRCVVTAPITGVVIDGEPQPGQVVSAGDQLLKIAPGGGLRFDALVPNSEIAGLEVGQSARVKLSAYPYQQYGAVSGRVAYISPDAKSVSGQGASGTTGYLIRIELLETDFGPEHPIELGMSGHAEIVRGSEHLLTLALGKLEKKVRVR